MGYLAVRNPRQSPPYPHQSMTTQPDAPVLPPVPAPARKRGQPYGPGLTPGVLVVAAVAFFLLMSSGSLVLVQTLRVTQEDLQSWPVPRKRVRTGPLESTPAISPEALDAIYGDLPGRATPQGPMTVMSDPWLRYFPEVEKAMAARPQDTPVNMMEFFYKTPRTGTWGWAVMDPNSPFSFTVPDTRQMARQKERVQQYKEAEAAGFPEDPVTGAETQQEKEQAAAAERAREKRRKELSGKS